MFPCNRIELLSEFLYDTEERKLRKEELLRVFLIILDLAKGSGYCQ
jgi:hypothetical protein